MFVSSNMEVLFNYLLGLVKTMNTKKTERANERRSENEIWNECLCTRTHIGLLWVILCVNVWPKVYFRCCVERSQDEVTAVRIRYVWWFVCWIEFQCVNNVKNVIPLCLTNAAFCFASHFAFSAAAPFSDTDTRLSLSLTLPLSPWHSECVVCFIRYVANHLWNLIVERFLCVYGPVNEPA